MEYITIENGVVVNRTVGKDPNAKLSIPDQNPPVPFGSITSDGGQTFELPQKPDKNKGRNLTWGDFLAVGMATDPVKMNTILLKLPVAAEWGRSYEVIPGIEFADATAPGSKLKSLLDLAIASQIIDQQTVILFLQNWVAKYPAI